jgi:hypothetical protein
MNRWTRRSDTCGIASVSIFVVFRCGAALDFQQYRAFVQFSTWQASFLQKIPGDNIVSAANQDFDDSVLTMARSHRFRFGPARAV